MPNTRYSLKQRHRHSLYRLKALRDATGYAIAETNNAFGGQLVALYKLTYRQSDKPIAVSCGMDAVCPAAVDFVTNERLNRCQIK